MILSSHLSVGQWFPNVVACLIGAGEKDSMSGRMIES